VLNFDRHFGLLEKPPRLARRPALAAGRPLPRPRHRAGTDLERRMSNSALHSGERGLRERHHHIDLVALFLCRKDIGMA